MSTAFNERVDRATDEALKGRYADKIRAYADLCHEFNLIREISGREPDKYNRAELRGHMTVITTNCRRLEAWLTQADEPLWVTLQRVMRKDDQIAEVQSDLHDLLQKVLARLDARST